MQRHQNLLYIYLRIAEQSLCEANGVVTNIQGGDFTWGAMGIIAANFMLHQKWKTEVAPLASV